MLPWPWLHVYSLWFAYPALASSSGSIKRFPAAPSLHIMVPVWYQVFTGTLYTVHKHAPHQLGEKTVFSCSSHIISEIFSLTGLHLITWSFKLIATTGGLTYPYQFGPPPGPGGGVSPTKLASLRVGESELPTENHSAVGWGMPATIR